MKIAIPVEEKSLDIDVCVSFARAPYFLVFDTETNEVSYVENSAAQAQGGAGIKASQLIIDLKVNSVIIPRLGQNAADVLLAADVEILKSEKCSTRQNLDLYNENKLSTLTSFHAGYHGIGGV